MYFPQKASGLAGMAAGVLLFAGLGPLSPLATEDHGAAVITIQGETGHFCVLAGVEDRVVRCDCPSGDGARTPPWLRVPEQHQVHFPVPPGQGGKTLQSVK